VHGVPGNKIENGYLYGEIYYRDDQSEKIHRQGRLKVQRTDLAAKAAKNAKEIQKQETKI
jgi:hypothetical protein